MSVRTARVCRWPRLAARKLFLDAWLQYGICVVFVPFVALDFAGFMPGLSSFLLFLAAVSLLFVEPLFMFLRWKRRARRRWLGFLPGAALFGTLVFGWSVGRALGSELIVYRFERSRAEYEQVADQVERGAYPRAMRDEHRHLGFWATPLEERSEDGSSAHVGIAFLVISHGFAGHVGFVRLKDTATAQTQRLLEAPPPGVWSAWLGPLGDNWFIVAN